MSDPKGQIFDQVNGDPFFLQLVNIFYDKVAKDELLSPMFHNSFDDAKHNLYLFLRKIFGGPDEYTLLRGNPMMRKRHLPFSIGLQERNRWLKLMLESMDEVGVTKNNPAREIMEEYFQFMATRMINREVKSEDYNLEGTT